ncbi:ABC transporter ATP-binding protein [Gardnerella vaginalis]|uniref:ABC transporter ATP-binding protein n=1 Tax=Gardnerella TaxID=2701 RepID=UPI0007F8F11A|nr:ABC transporter ATP-binding protein [Gardnerella vaginalis]MDK7260198.1 ABC transporter ATP-binding protein [Gardnerella vaginalis]MDK8338400.1 ABC transporter ATP-binding protein [Gardnerella vaginalis]MDK8777036.1 ABC transporter ATP-binding protein [Gardnerella vaginalis]NSX28072.1 ABC transporter ATP-binding protein [Gardnerella vaginalis]PKY96626.1 ABC transporter ATP-binding protein [Gardnerella vaginalis]
MYVNPSKRKDASNVRWVLQYCKPDMWRVGVSLVLFTINDTMAMTMPLLSGFIVDKVIIGKQHDLLAFVCVLMVAMMIIRVGSRYIYQLQMERFGQNAVYRLVSDEYEKLHSLDFTYFNHTRTGDIMSRMTSDTDAIRHILSWVSYMALDCLVMFVFALVIMFSIQWQLALALMAITPFLFWLAKLMGKNARPKFLAIRESFARMNSMVEENIEGNRVVKAFVREPFETQKFDKCNEDYFNRNITLAKNTQKYMPWLDGMGFALELVTVGFGGWLVLNGSMTLGAFVTFNSFLWMLHMPVRMVGWLINDWQRFNAGCVNIRKLLTQESHIDLPSAAKKNVKVKGRVTFEHVDFAFPDDLDSPILSDIDLDVPAGTKLGILGETGSGKSTLVSLIARFYDPTRGRVLIDGKDVREWPLETVRNQVSIVAQETFLFSDTIAGNISFGLPQNEENCKELDNTIRRMARIADADDFIMSMPEGYETVVGERGVGLSGGQKQRLSLARALANNPAILIMDDTTSAVDMETEEHIQKELKKLDGSRTVITIAHRISSVKDADMIIVLDHGKIVERGTHEHLVASHGRYWEIYKKQLGMQMGKALGFEDLDKAKGE